ncbi:TolC family protein [Fusobacterium mortiferum]|uniref:TolC family protein n=1 Tax=Fusobacterium mortiferum TaxID=850 RepID=A0ABS2G4K4_FUSMR|nr:TolC family protein [Fusobacterium mortiferum]MBM6876037.1 TolC family protein [Fusobacterium mortiferum]
MKKIWGLLLVLSSSVFARELTLDQAIQMALDNSKEIKISQKDVETAKLNVGIAFKNALPSVVYTGSYTRSEYEREITKKEKPSNRASEKVPAKGGYLQKITISQPIFQGGAILGGIQYANAYKNIADLLYLGSQRDIRLETIQVYSDIVRNEKDLEALISSREELKATYDKQKAQLDLRLITKADMLKTEYSILEVESQIIGTQNQIAVQKENLKLKLGLPRTEDLTVVEFDVPMYLSRNIDFKADLNQALIESIDAMIASKYVDMADAQRKVARADMLPQVSAFASYGVESDRRKYNATMDDAEWRGGVQITWNVFEFGKNYDSYRVAAISKEQEELREKISKDTIDINVTDAYLELIKLEKERDSKGRALEAAIENYKIDKEKYAAGLISTIDFLASETQVREAKVGYNQVVIDYLYAFEKYRSMLI